MSYRNFVAVTFTASLVAAIGCSDSGSSRVRTVRDGRLEVRVAPESTPAPTAPVRRGDASGTLAATPPAATEAGLPRVVVVIPTQPTRLLVRTRTLEEMDTAPPALDAAALARR